MLAVLCLAAFLALSLTLGVCLTTPERLHEVALWIERAQRIPSPVLNLPERASLALGGGRVRRVRATASVPESFSLPTSGPVVAVAEREGELVAATFDDGAYRVVAGADPGRLPLGDAVNDLAFDSAGTLYAATDDGAFRLDAKGACRLGVGAFSAVAVWRGQPWFSSRRGLSVQGERGFVTYGIPAGFEAQSPGSLSACGEVLCVGAADGLWDYDGTRFRHHTSGSGSLPTDYVTAVAFGSGRRWAGTFDGGLARVGEGDGRRYAPADGLPEGRVQPRALAVADDTVYASTPTGLLLLRGDRAALVADGLPQAELTAARVARAGGVWVGYRGGISRVVAELAP